jgi:hypothetical protein
MLTGTPQSDPGYEDPAGQAAAVPEADNCDYGSGEGDSERVPEAGRREGGEASATTQEVSREPAGEDGCTARAARGVDERCGVCARTKGCSVRLEAGY